MSRPTASMRGRFSTNMTTAAASSSRTMADRWSWRCARPGLGGAHPRQLRITGTASTLRMRTEAVPPHYALGPRTSATVMALGPHSPQGRPARYQVTKSRGQTMQSATT